MPQTNQTQMNRNKLFAAALIISMLSFIGCMAAYMSAVYAEAQASPNMDIVPYFLGIAAFVIADIIASCACLAGKMKDKSIVYSVSRLFIVIYCMNFTDRYKLMLVPIIISALMYILSLYKDFRAFASRNTPAAGADEVENERK